MSMEHVKGSIELLPGISPPRAADTLVSLGDATPGGIGQRLRLLVLRRSATALLRRTLQPSRRTRLDELSPYLLDDIGLPPDTRS